LEQTHKEGATLTTGYEDDDLNLDDPVELDRRLEPLELMLHREAQEAFAGGDVIAMSENAAPGLARVHRLMFGEDDEARAWAVARFVKNLEQRHLLHASWMAEDLRTLARMFARDLERVEAYELSPRALRVYIGSLERAAGELGKDIFGTEECTPTNQNTRCASKR
jgi:hypothetical protein